jgi:hypothetical protein
MKKTLVLSLVSAIFILNSCIKEMDVFIPDPGQVSGPDTIWYSAITSSMPVVTLKKNLLLPRDIDSIQNNLSSSFVSSSGLQCSIDTNSFLDDSGHIVRGKIAIETNLLIKKGDFIKMSNPTSSGNKIMISGGAFFVNATNNGKQLRLAPDKKFTVQYNVVNTFPALNLYNGDGSNIEKFNWIQNADTVNGKNTVVSVSNSFEIVCNKLNWMNCQYQFDTAGIKYTNISVTLPPTYTNFNTIAYLVFNDFNSVLGIYGNNKTRTFMIGGVPVGRSVKVVTITKEGNFYYLGNQEFVTAQVPQAGSNSIQNINIIPNKQSLLSIKEFLTGL